MSLLPSGSQYLRYFAGAFVVVALATALTMLALVAYSSQRSPGWMTTSAWEMFIACLFPFSLPSFRIAVGLQSWFDLPGGGWALLLTMGVGAALTASAWAALAAVAVNGFRRLSRRRSS